MARVRQLIARLREELDDIAEPVFWTDTLLLSYLDEAQMEACGRARLIRDDAHPDICQVRFRAGDERVTIDDRVLHIRRAKVRGERAPLTLSGYDVLDEDCPGWQSRTGMPTTYLPDMSSCSIRLVPTPTLDGVLELLVERHAVHEITLLRLDDCPEIPRQRHYQMLEWAKYLAYMRQDGDRFDPEAAARAATRFAVHFGEPRDAETEELLRRRRDFEIRADFI